MKANSFFLIAVLCASGLFLQSCWKDKTIKDKKLKDDIHLNITPSYGIPIVNLKIKGEDVVTRINRDSSSNSFFVEYEGSDNLCVIVYDKVNIPIVVPPTFTVFDTVVKYPLNFFKDLRIDGWSPMLAYFMLYVDNSYTTSFNSKLVKLVYEDRNGVTNKQVLDASVTLPVNGRTVEPTAVGGGTPRRTLAIDSLRINGQEADDIIFNGRETTVEFGVSSSNPPGSNGKLNLNPRIRVPGHIKAEGIIRNDTMAFDDFGKIAEYAEENRAVTAESATLYLKFINALPLDAKIQVYFADTNHRILDSIHPYDIFVKAGIYNASTYLIQTPTLSEEAVVMTKDKLKRLKDTKYLIIRELFTSKDNSGIVKDVKLFKSNYMDVIISIKLDAKIDGTIKDITNEFSNEKK